MKNDGAAGVFYGLGFVGALVYYIQHAASFWNGVLGVLKAAIWPAMILHRVMEMIKM